MDKISFIRGVLLGTIFGILGSLISGACLIIIEHTAYSQLNLLLVMLDAGLGIFIVVSLMFRLISSN